MSEFTASLALPALVGHDGKTYTAQRLPRLKDGLAFLRAAEAKSSIADQLEGARAILLGMGFPVEVVDDLDMAEVVERASGFFTAAFQRNGTGS